MDVSEESPHRENESLKAESALALPISPASTVDRVGNIEMACLPQLFTGSENLSRRYFPPFVRSCLAQNHSSSKPLDLCRESPSYAENSIRVIVC